MISLLLSFQSIAQTTFTGCKSGNDIYNQTGNTPITNSPYYATYAYSTLAPACPRAELIGARRGSCYLSNIGIFGDSGDLYTYTVLTSPLGCPLDDRLNIFTVILGAFAFLILRKRDSTYQNTFE